MKVLFLTLYPEVAASPRYRVAQFVPHLRNAGIQCTVAAAVSPEQYARLTGPNRVARPLWYHLAETRRRLGQLLGARGFDVVFVQKSLMSAYLRGMLHLLRMCARRVVYDLDDAVHLQPPHPLRGIWRAVEDHRQAARLLAAADLVLAGNEWLVAQASNLGATAVHFPTVVDTERFHPPAESPLEFRIGWIGNPSTTPSLEVLGKDFPEAADSEIRLIGADPARSPWPRAAIEPWSLDSEVAALQQFAVGLMPLPKDEWSRGKCALKALQYMACGVPCVATPFGAVLDIIRDGENGLFADSPEAWQDAVRRLRDPALRRRLAEAGRATVEARFALDQAAPRMRELLESVA